MTEEKLLRVEAERDLWPHEYYPDYDRSSKKRFLLGYFSKDAAISILDEVIGSFHYVWPAEPNACDDQNAVMIRLL